MSFRTYHLAAASAALMFAATSAAALTAAEVWADWQETSAGFGQTLSVGSEEASGGVLTLRDVSLTLDSADSSVNGTISEIVMTERSDGSVAIEMSDEFPLDMTMTPAEGQSGSFSMLINQSDLELVATGEPGAISYTYSAPSVTVTMSDMMTEGQETDLGMVMTLSGLAGSYNVAGTDPRSIESSLTGAALSMQMSGTDPKGSGDTFSMTVNVSGLTSESSGTITPFAGMTDLGEMMAAGFETRSTTTHGPMTYEFSGTSDGSMFSMNGKADEGSYDVDLGPDGLSYGGGSRGVSVAFSGSEIPFPEVTFEIEEAGGRIRMPMTVTEEPQDTGLNIRLVGLTISDMIWSMFDPAGALPRDPATLIVDISGKANWLVDVFDPAVAEQGIDEVPGKVEQVTINEILLSLAGAELTGSGGFDIDNDGPMPQPAGTLNLQLVGGNGLLDKLVQMGMIPEDQAMGARMMLGLFARPGSGEDTLVSEITVQPDGAVLANGQRIR